MDVDTAKYLGVLLASSSDQAFWVGVRILRSTVTRRYFDAGTDNGHRPKGVRRLICELIDMY